MMNIKKLMIILVLTLFIVQIAYASDINESVCAEINEIIIDDVIEIDETNEEIISWENVDETINDFVVEDNMPPEEYIDSDINNSYEKSLEVEISDNQYNNYKYEILDESLDTNTEFDETDDENYSSFNNISYKASTSYMLLVCNKLEVNFEINYLNDHFIEFNQLNEYDAMTLDSFTYTNKNCCDLTHAVKNIIFCSDKLNSKFVYSIDNSIVGSPSNFYNYSTNFSIINYPQYSLYFFTSFYLTGHVYDFFSVLNNQINEVCSFII